MNLSSPKHYPCHAKTEEGEGSGLGVLVIDLNQSRNSPDYRHHIETDTDSHDEEP